MSSRSPAIESALRLPTDSGVHRLPNVILGTILFIASEIMFFAALISAFTIARSAAIGGVWPPPGQPRLPVEQTAFNTAALLLSGIVLWAGTRHLRAAPALAQRYVAVAIALGVTFVSLQGVEWVALLREGLTMTSSSHGSFFYLIVGAHALHAVAAILVLTWMYVRMVQRRLVPERFTATRIFWYFVVVLWPVIYLRVYL
jgi:heme/copper-type cytochrome/quinol oxidase subunit 3